MISDHHGRVTDIATSLPTATDGILGRHNVGLAEMAYQPNELDTALRHVTEDIALCREFAYTPPLAAGLVTLA